MKLVLKGRDFKIVQSLLNLSIKRVELSIDVAKTSEERAFYERHKAECEDLARRCAQARLADTSQDAEEDEPEEEDEDV